MPWAFMATSVTASHTPNSRSSPANTPTAGDSPRTAATSEATTIVATATAPSERLRMRTGATSPPTSAPAG